MNTCPVRYVNPNPFHQQCNVIHDDDAGDDVDTKIKLTSPIPRYVIHCKAKALKPKFFESVPLFKQLKPRTETVFGYDFEIYDEDKGFEAKQFSFKGLRNYFILALHAAFMYHLPFQLRPDDIWIVIAQGIATHITENAEALRTKFVDFDGKKEIIVRDDSLNINSKNNDWSFVLNQFDEGIRNLTNNDISDLMTCDFSTSSIVTQTASKCVLFKAMGEYFKFTTMTLSGIPEIRLVGSLADWKKVQTKCQKLKQMNIGLDFWLQHLLPVIDNIVDTVTILSGDGELNERLHDFWDSIYHLQSQSGGDGVSGWVKTLFPYDIHQKKNPELDWELDKQREITMSIAMSPQDFPGSFSRAPMIWKYFDMEIKCGMYGGIFGFAQQAESGCIAPVIGWVIAGKV